MTFFMDKIHSYDVELEILLFQFLFHLLEICSFKIAQNRLIRKLKHSNSNMRRWVGLDFKGVFLDTMYKTKK